MMSRRDVLLLVGVGALSTIVAAVMIVCFTDEFKSAPSLSLFLSSVASFGFFEYMRVLSVVTGIVSVYLASRENIWVWPVGIVWCLSTAWVMYSWKFFGDMALMFVYLFLQIHGWWSWKHGSADKKELPIRRASWKTLALVGVLVTLAIWPTSMFLSLEWVHGKAPFWDSFTTVGSLGAQFLLNRKYIENWIVWIIVDIVFVPVYFYFGLVDQAVLYAVFLVLAVIGLVQWSRVQSIAQVESSPYA